MIDRGFQLMIPKEPKEVSSKELYDYQIKFTLFKKEFVLKFKVNDRS